ncbi:DinB family protein [Paenisporosarcina cavernae]|uniref:Damage-inducible protein DinB n=1 Tax=Paenisporosarcina cavernae TaxID=2320858 RepID=A0A385YW00_9BACL|nr:DinB family protein [Paenisporosarcina cavernae]AYC30651.1 hypothetical protein D3873_12760 [Paenisporosarcina cavernae]
MYHTVEEFLKDWEFESEQTAKLFVFLTDESLSYRASEQVRSIGFLAWHVVTSIHEIGSRLGLTFHAPEHDAPMPQDAASIRKGYEQASKGIAEALRSQWQDADLQKESDMYGEMWKNHLSLAMLDRHQIHHRGQLTTLMRLAGLPLIGAYGPSQEEWQAHGAPIPE